MNNIEIKDFLSKNAEKKYAEFSSALIPANGLDKRPMYGVRISILRDFAKKIAKGDYSTFLENAHDDSFEEVVLQGLVIGYANIEIDEALRMMKKFIPKITDWSINDITCSTFKIARKNREKVWDFLMQYKDSGSEFEQRVVAVMLLNHFLVDDYIDLVLEVYDSLKHNGYYRMMGVAWGIQAAYVKFPEKVMGFLKNNNLDDVTYNKAIQKLLESYKVSEADKNILRRMKRL